MVVLAVIVIALLGAWVSRMCGGGKPLDGGIPKLIYAVPYGMISFLAAGPLWGVLGFMAAALGKRTGHGQYITLGRYRQPAEQDERLDFIVRFFMGPDTGFNAKRDLFGLKVTGLAVTLLPGVIVMLSGYFLAGLFIVCSGAMKSLAYWIGDRWAVWTGREYSSFTGECLTGFFGWGALAVAFAEVR